MKNIFKNKKLVAMIAIVMALCIGIGAAAISSVFMNVDIKQHVYSTDGVSIDLTQTEYPGDNSDQVKNLMALSEVPKNPVIKNTGKTDAFMYMAVTIPYDTVALTTYDGTPTYKTLTQLFSYGYEGNAGVRDSWKLIKEGYFGDVKIVPVDNVLQGATETHGAYDAANKTVTYVWAYTGENETALKELAWKESTEALFDYIKVADIDGQTAIDGSTQIVVVSAYGIQADNIVNNGAYDPAQCEEEDVLNVWNILNKLTPAADVSEDEHPDTDVIIRKLIDGPSFNSIIKEAAKGNTINAVRFVNTKIPSGVTKYDVSNRQNGGIVAWYQDGEIYVAADDGSDIMANEDSSYMFSGLNNAANIEFACLYTDAVVDASYMFQDCSSLTYVDTSKFNTASVLTMEGMFKGCARLETISAGDLEMHNVTNISHMFSGCSSLNGVETNKWNLENCITSAGMFQNCSKLTSLDISGFAKNNITNMSYMFSGCSKLEKIDTTKINTEKVMNFEGMFQNCSSVTEFAGVGNMNVANATNMKYMFQNCDGMAKMDLILWKIDNVQAMDYMFEGCDSLSWLSVQDWTITSLTSCDYMFANGGFAEIYGTDWNAEKTIKAPNMFLNSPGLPDYKADVIDWSKAYVGGYFMLPPNTLVRGELFQGSIPEEATSVVFLKSAIPGINDGVQTFASLPDSEYYTKYDAEPLNYIVTTSGLVLTDVSAAQNYTVLAWMDGTQYKIASVDGEIMRTHPNSRKMFYAQEQLTTIDFGVNGVITTELTKDFRQMFQNCYALKQLNISTFDTSNATQVGDMFAMSNSYSALTTIYVSDLWDVSSFGTTTLHYASNSRLDKLIGQSGASGYGYYLKANDANYQTGAMTYYDGEPNTIVAGPNFNALVPDNTTEIYIGDYHNNIPEDKSQWINFAITDDYAVVGFVDETKLYITTQDGSEIKTCGSMYQMFKDKGDGSLRTKNITTISFDNVDTSSTFNMAEIFYNLDALTTINGLEELETSNVNRMDYMFYSCEGLTQIDVSCFNTSSVVNMNSMFSRCINAKKIDVSGINTSKVEDFGLMFYDCYTLKQLNLSSFDTRNATQVSNMFTMSNSYSALTTIYVSDLWDVSSFGTTTLHYASNSRLDKLVGQSGTNSYGYNLSANEANYQTGAMTYYDGEPNTIVAGPNFNALLPANTTEVYIGDYSNNIPEDDTKWIDFSITEDYAVVGFLDGTKLYITTQDGSEIKTCGSMYQMFKYDGSKYNRTQNITTITFDNIDTSSTFNMAEMLYNLDALTTINGLEELETSNVNNMREMFYSCGKMPQIDVSCFDTSSVVNMSGMFNGCTAASKIDVSGINTSKVEDFRNMFYDCYTLKQLNLSSFDTSSATRVSDMFTMLNSSSALTTIYVSDLWDVSSFGTTNLHYGRNNPRLDKLVGQSGTNSYGYNLSANEANYQTGAMTYYDGEPNTIVAGPNFNALIPSGMTEIYFGDYHENIPEDNTKWIDFSVAQDYAVIGFLDGTKLYITTQDGSEIKTCGSMYQMFKYDGGKYNRTQNITTITFDNIDTSSTFNMAEMFYNLDALTTINGLEELETSNVNNMRAMFYSCGKIPQIDVSCFDTSNVVNMNNMFSYCINAQKIDVSGIDTSKVEDFRQMFYDCYTLKQLNLSSFDTSSATQVSDMFTMSNSYSALTTIYVSDLWDVSSFGTTTLHYGGSNQRLNKLVGQSGTNSYGYYLRANEANYQTGAMTYYDGEPNTIVAGPNFNALLPANTTEVYIGDYSNNIPEDNTKWIDFSVSQDYTVVGFLDGTKLYITTQDGSEIKTCGSMYQMFKYDGSNYNRTQNITTITFDNVDTSSTLNMAEMFYSLKALTTINGLDELETSNVNNMREMFCYCNKIPQIDISCLDTSSVVNMNGMFNGCTLVSKINVSGIDTSKVEDFRYMFQNCTALKQLNLSSFDTSSATQISDMFTMSNSSSALTTIYVSDLWDVSSFGTTTLHYAGNSARLNKLVGQSGTNSYWYYLYANDANYQTGAMTYYDGEPNTIVAGPVFTSLIPTTTTEIRFGDYHENIPAGTTLYDFSAGEDGSVVGWLEGTVLFVTTTDGSVIKTTGSMVRLFWSESTSATLKKVDLSGLDFADATSMGWMFYNRTGLTEIVWPEDMNTSNITNMSYMFYNCYALPSVNVANWDVSKVTDMSYMFYNASSITTIDLSSWELVSCKNTSFMFYSNRNMKLTTIFAKDWRNYNITSSGNMFGRGSTSYAYPLVGAIAYSGNGGRDIAYANYLNGYFSILFGEHNALLPGSKLNTKIPTNATKVVFADAVAEGVSYVDVSEMQDGSVVGWTSSNVFYIAAVDGGKVIAHPVSSYMFQNKTRLTSVDFTNLDFSNVETAQGMFYGCSSLTSFNETINTENLLYTKEMFYGCTKLASFDFTGWNTSKVTDMSYMFYNCTALTSVNFADVDTSNLWNMEYMFYNCQKLASLDLTALEVEKVSRMDYTFYNCYGLKTLDMTGWNTESLERMYYTFYGCYGLTELSVNHFNVSKVSVADYCFYNMNSVRILDLSNWVFENTFTSGYMFAECDNLQTIYANDWTTKTTSNNVFYNSLHIVGNGAAYIEYYHNANQASPARYFCTKPELVSGMMAEGNIANTLIPSNVAAVVFTNSTNGATNTTDLSALSDGSVLGWADGTTYYIAATNGERVIAHPNSAGLFRSKSSLKTIDFTGLDTSKVYNMNYMFRDCSALTSVNTEMMDISNVVSMWETFLGCSKLTRIDTTGWNMSKNTSVHSMFYNCASLTEVVGIENWDTSSVEKAAYMFRYCPAFETLRLTNWNVSKLMNAYYMFDGMSNLMRLDLSNWVMPSSINTTQYMFNNCPKLYYIYANDWSTIGGTSSYLFNNVGIMNGASSSNSNMMSVYAKHISNGGYFSDINVAESNVLAHSGMVGGVIPTNATSVVFGSELTVPEGVKTYDVSHAWDGSVVGWLQGTTFYITTIDNGTLYMNENCSHLFRNKTALKTIDFGDVDWSKTTNMSYMFYGCTALIDADLANIETDTATDMSYMFYNCTALPEAQVEDWNVENVENMSYMFYGARSIVELNLSKWNIESLKNTSYMFAMNGAAKLQTIYAGDWREYGITSSSYMFQSGSTYPLSGAIKYTGTDARDVNYANPVSGYFTAIGGIENMMMSGASFNNTIPTNATSVVFTDTVAEGFTYTDVSDKRDGSILAWLNGTTYYVAPVNGGKILAHPAMAHTFYGKTKLQTVDLTNLDFEATTSMFEMFYGCTGLTSFDEDLSTAVNVVNIHRMFYNCTNLVDVDLSTLDVSECTTLNSMFYNCSKLTSVNLDGWDTGKITDMSYMFYGCVKLPSIDLSHFDTSNVTTTSYMFYDCRIMTDVNLIEWNTKKVTTMTYMFYNCDGLTVLDLGSFDITSLTNADYMFYDCSNLTTIYAMNWYYEKTTLGGSAMFRYCNKLVGAVAYNGNYNWNYAHHYSGYFTAPDGVETKNVMIAGSTLNGKIPSNATSVKFGDYSANIPASGTTNLSAVSNGIVVGWSEGTTYYISTTDGSKIVFCEDAYRMFYNKTSLTEVVFENIDASRVTRMQEMFYGCTKLVSVDLSMFNSDKVYTMSYMFQGCSALKNVNMSSIKTDYLTSMYQMFYNCTNLQVVDLSSFNTAKVTETYRMFYNNYNLTTIYVGSGWDISSATSTTQMFYGCNKLPNFSSSYVDKTKAYADGDGKGYLIINHTYGDWSLDTLPTCTENGFNVRTCTECGHIDKEVLYPTGHKADENNICTVCGEDATYAFDTFSQTYYMGSGGGWYTSNEGYYYAVIPVEVGKTYKATLTDVTTITRWRCAQASSDVIGSASLSWVGGSEAPANGNTITFTATMPYLICYSSIYNGGAVIMTVIE